MLAVPKRAYALLRWLVKLEIGIWRSLFLLVTRRVPGSGPGVRLFSYAKEVTPFILVIIFVSAVELVAVHLLLPWETVRLVLDLVSVWGLLWMIGFLASMRVFPHLLDDHGLRVRHGTGVDIHVPWEAVASVTAQRRGVSSRSTVEVQRDEDAGAVSVAVLRQTRVDVVLRAPTTLVLPDGPAEVGAVRLYADDPRGFVAAARERLAVRATSPG